MPKNPYENLAGLGDDPGCMHDSIQIFMISLFHSDFHLSTARSCILEGAVWLSLSLSRTGPRGCTICYMPPSLPKRNIAPIQARHRSCKATRRKPEALCQNPDQLSAAPDTWQVHHGRPEQQRDCAEGGDGAVRGYGHQHRAGEPSPGHKQPGGRGGGGPCHHPRQ